MLSESIAAGKALGMTAQPFVYHPVRPDDGSSGNSDLPLNSTLAQLWDTAGEPSRGLGTKEEEWQDRERQASERGVQEGKNQASREFEEALAREREALAATVRNFVQERDAYFRDVEAEVVRLALGIARRILNREAQLDPMVLAGVVRVALEKVSTSTGLRLHVHPSRLDGWQDYFDRHPDLRTVPELVPDASLEEDRCVLETAIGTTELSHDSQLKEIEQGFFDLLDRKPRGSS